MLNLPPLPQAADQDTPAAAAEGTTDKQANKEEKQDEQTAADKAEGNGDDKAATTSGTGSLFGSAGTTGFGGFGGFGGLAGGTTSFGAGGFGGFAAAAKGAPAASFKRDAAQFYAVECKPC